ncbi:hypothetical protein HGB13_00225 [bacterium]|nr:hypothetical protein [bacterium]
MTEQNKKTYEELTGRQERKKECKNTPVGDMFIQMMKDVCKGKIKFVDCKVVADKFPSG